MHTALVAEWGQPPKYIEVDPPPQPSSDSGTVQIRVTAAGLHSLVRSRAAGTHYTAKILPHIPGTDGVGTTSDGQAVYFSSFATGGSFSDIVNIPRQAITPIPSGVDPLQVAAFVNPGLSSWMALKTRTAQLPPDFNVLIMGATSASGNIAISIARALGARKVAGCARSMETLSTLGLDEVIPLCSPVTETDFSKLGDVDVILDYLYGPPTEHLLQSLASARPVQYVHIGSLAALDINLPGAVLRSTNLTIRGSGPGSFTMPEMGAEIPKLLETFSRIKSHKLRVVPLSEVEKAWSEKGTRIVFLP